MNSFRGKSVIVTGGSRGIGKAVAKNFFDQGASVLICSRSKSEVTSACSEIDPSRKKCFGIKADVSVIKDCGRLIKYAVKKFGKIDILINNAGIYGEIGKLETSNLKNWAKTIEVNLLGAVNCTKFAILFMKKSRGGKIINFAGAGVGGKKGLPNFSAYYTSKISIAGFTETIAEELKQDNIQINCISPGPVNTGITDYLLAQGIKKTGKQMYQQALNQKKESKNTPDLAIKMINFLCSKKANHLSGRLFSSKWDSITLLQSLNNEGDMFKLRRIDGQLFDTKKN